MNAILRVGWFLLWRDDTTMGVAMRFIGLVFLGFSTIFHFHGRDQLVAGVGVAPVDRGVRGRRGATAHAGAVSRGSL